MKNRSRRSVMPAILMLLGTAAVVPSALSVKASTLVWASVVIESQQGLLWNFLPVQMGKGGILNCNPDNALFASDAVAGAFDRIFSLGYGGHIILGFPDPVCGSLTIYEATWADPYPPETADVYVSQDGTTWTFLGTADNTMNPGDPVHPKTWTLSTWIKYVKIIDTTERGDFDPAQVRDGDLSDGFDLDAVSAGTLFVIPEMPLGTITALIMSLAAFALIKRKTLIAK